MDGRINQKFGIRESEWNDFIRRVSRMVQQYYRSIYILRRGKMEE